MARDVLRGRLTGLPAETCEALEVACVVGQEFDMPVLQAALGLDAKTLLLRLDDAARARLIAPRRRAGTYGFVHDTIREALYEELSTARRVELHGRIARAIEERPRGDFSINELAYHSYRSLPQADPAKVEQYAREAAEAAMGTFAYEESSEFYEGALEARRFRSDADARGQCELRLAFATTLRRSGQVRDAQKHIERAIEIARQNKFADLLSTAARKLRPSAATALVADPLALQALEDASALVTDNEPSLRIRILAQLACMPPYSLSIEKSQELSAQAVALARQGNDSERPRRGAAQPPCTRCRDPTRSTSCSRWPPRSRVSSRTTSRRCATRPSSRAFRATSTRATCPAPSEPSRTWAAWAARCAVPRRCGTTSATRRRSPSRPAASTRRSRCSTTCSRRGGGLRLPYGKFFFMMHVLVLAYERTGFGILQNAETEWRTHLDWAASLPSYQAHEIRCLFEMKRTEEARQAFDAMARKGFDSITRELGYLNALAQLSVVAVGFGDRERAESLYALLRPYPSHNTPTNFGFYQGSVSYFLGLLAAPARPRARRGGAPRGRAGDEHAPRVRPADRADAAGAGERDGGRRSEGGAAGERSRGASLGNGAASLDGAAARGNRALPHAAGVASVAAPRAIRGCPKLGTTEEGLNQRVRPRPLRPGTQPGRGPPRLRRGPSHSPPTLRAGREGVERDHFAAVNSGDGDPVDLPRRGRTAWKARHPRDVGRWRRSTTCVPRHRGTRRHRARCARARSSRAAPSTPRATRDRGWPNILAVPFRVVILEDVDEGLEVRASQRDDCLNEMSETNFGRPAP